MLVLRHSHQALTLPSKERLPYTADVFFILEKR
jgi:hypothetical protein